MAPLKRLSLFLALCLTLFLSNCGYRIEEKQETISLGSIKGDPNGAFARTLTQLLATSGRFQYQDKNGRFLLEVALIGEAHTSIGYQFDRDPLSGKTVERLVPNERRREVTAQMSLIDRRTQQVIKGPITITAFVDYDFVDSDSLKDAAFIHPDGRLETSLSFSRGQLDSIRGAQAISTSTIQKQLATKIVEGISNLF